MKDLPISHQQPDITVEDLAKLPDADPNPVLCISATGEVLYSNQSGTALLDEWDCQVGSPLPDNWRRTVVQTMASGTHQEIDAACGDRFFSLVLVPVADTNCLNIYGRDIAKYQETEEALRESERRLKTIFATTNEGFWLIDNQAITLDANPTMCAILGQALEEIMGKHIFDFVDATNERIFKEEIERRKQGAMGAYEIALSRPDGTQVPCLFNATPFFDEAGQKIGSFAMVTDITEHKESEVALLHAKEAAEEANRAKSIFLANMSHELRTPLNAILGFTQLASRDRSLNPQQRENLDIIGRSGEHLLTLINDVLEMSKIEAGQAELNEEDLDLYWLLDGLEEMFQLRAQEEGLELIVECAPQVPQYVRTDGGKLRQVLLNLLNNAIKFTETGSVILQANYAPLPQSGEKPTGRLAFAIEDTGPGIAAEEMEKLFDAFVQTATGRKVQEGTGLGLPISQQFIHLMGGEISVESIVDKGSTFKFDIQVELAEAVSVQRAQPTRRPVGLEPDQPTYRILVVEDKWANRRLLVNLLESLEFEVREAENGQEGIAVWEEWEPHLIWMDMRMPVMDGYEATKRIKATTKGQATLIIALTASAFEEQRSVVLSAGCDEFMRKPFREAEIFDAMTRHLGVRFVYEEIRAEDTVAKPQQILTPTVLSALPATWLAQVHQAASQADEEAIFILLEQLGNEHGAVADALKDLVNGFQFDRIMALTT